MSSERAGSKLANKIASKLCVCLYNVLVRVQWKLQVDLQIDGCILIFYSYCTHAHVQACNIRLASLNICSKNVNISSIFCRRLVQLSP